MECISDIKFAIEQVLEDFKDSGEIQSFLVKSSIIKDKYTVSIYINDTETYAVHITLRQHDAKLQAWKNLLYIIIRGSFNDLVSRLRSNE